MGRTDKPDPVDSNASCIDPVQTERIMITVLIIIIISLRHQTPLQPFLAWEAEVLPTRCSRQLNQATGFAYRAERDGPIKVNPGRTELTTGLAQRPGARTVRGGGGAVLHAWRRTSKEKL